MRPCVRFVENIEAGDAEILPNVSQYIHASGGGNLKFVWIPYYDAPGFANWSQYGFDVATLQPNYAFHNCSKSRFAEVRAVHIQYYMNINNAFIIAKRKWYPYQLISLPMGASPCAVGGCDVIPYSICSLVHAKTPSLVHTKTLSLVHAKTLSLVHA